MLGIRVYCNIFSSSCFLFFFFFQSSLQVLYYMLIETAKQINGKEEFLNKSKWKKIFLGFLIIFILSLTLLYLLLSTLECDTSVLRHLRCSPMALTMVSSCSLPWVTFLTCSPLGLRSLLHIGSSEQLAACPVSKDKFKIHLFLIVCSPLTQLLFTFTAPLLLSC